MPDTGVFAAGNDDGARLNKVVHTYAVQLNDDDNDDDLATSRSRSRRGGSVYIYIMKYIAATTTRFVYFV